MITKETVKTLVEEWLSQKENYFLVDIQMDGDRIVIEVDHADGVWIEDCAELSRFLQEKLGEELGDYELEVGSAGLGQPFKVEQQYLNHVGDDVEVRKDNLQIFDADGNAAYQYQWRASGWYDVDEKAYVNEETFPAGQGAILDCFNGGDVAFTIAVPAALSAL